MTDHLSLFMNDALKDYFFQTQEERTLFKRVPAFYNKSCKSCEEKSNSSGECRKQAGDASLFQEVNEDGLGAGQRKD